MSEIKKVFVSRFGNKGVIVEADWSQLEVYVLAFLSGDTQLKKDLISGIDIHSMNASALRGQDYSVFMGQLSKGEPSTIKDRKLAKALSFQLQYGAGPTTMAKKNKCSEAVAKEFIRTYFTRYPGVKRYHDHLQGIVSINRKASTSFTPKGLPAGVSKYNSITGRIYTFYEQDDWKGGTSFSPTQVKNYPIQGFATGDIVPMVFGHVQEKLFRREHLYKNALLINTIHDSIIMDIKREVLTEVANLLRECMEDGVPVLLKKYFNIDFDLPLKMTLKYGPNWMEMKSYEFL